MTNTFDPADVVAGIRGRVSRTSRSSRLEASLDQLVAEVLGRPDGWPESIGELSTEQSAKLDDWATRNRVTPEAALAILRNQGKARAEAAERAEHASAIVDDIRGGALR